MIGAITSGPLADLVGRKGVSKSFELVILAAFVLTYLWWILYSGDESFFCILCSRVASNLLCQGLTQDPKQ